MGLGVFDPKHFFDPKNIFIGGSQSPSKALAGQAGGDRPRSRGGCREAQLFPQLGEDLGKPEEGGPAQPSTGEDTFETGAFQNQLNPKVMKKNNKRKKERRKSNKMDVMKIENPYNPKD